MSVSKNNLWPLPSKEPILPIRRKTLVVLKGYPRLSETFIAQELLGLERAGFDLTLISMRKPTDKKRHPIHDEIRARVVYLPEYLHEEPLRVLRALFAGWSKPGFKPLLRRFGTDLRRDVTRNRFRRLGQALVLAHEWPDAGEWLHAHFIHTPASVTAYASIMTGVPWTCSAHAKDIWTSPDWELTEKLAEARWSVTCTRSGYEHMRGLTDRREQVHLSYHGLDLARFDATDQIDLINKPLLMIAGSKADSLYMSEDAFAKATGTTDKELFKIEGATHIETYWVPEYVDAAMGKLTPFFNRTLEGTRG